MPRGDLFTPGFFPFILVGRRSLPLNFRWQKIGMAVLAVTGQPAAKRISLVPVHPHHRRIGGIPAPFIPKRVGFPGLFSRNHFWPCGLQRDSVSYPPAALNPANQALVTGYRPISKDSMVCFPKPSRSYLSPLMETKAFKSRGSPSHPRVSPASARALGSASVSMISISLCRASDATPTSRRFSWISNRDRQASRQRPKGPASPVFRAWPRCHWPLFYVPCLTGRCKRIGLFPPVFVPIGFNGFDTVGEVVCHKMGREKLLEGQMPKPILAVFVL